MNFVSALFLLIFLPGVMLLYQIMPRRYRWVVLLLASYGFFYSISQKLIVFILLSTFSIHHIGLWLEATKREYQQRKAEDTDKKRVKGIYTRRLRGIVFLGILLNIGTLLVLKYAGFFSASVNGICSAILLPVSLPVAKFAVPIGISFYTLQAVSYIADVYYGKIEADKNLGRLALFLSFFPTIMEGPICRYSETAAALHEGKPIRYQNAAFGMQRILWGLFKKLLIADRLNVFVSTVFDAPEKFSGSIILLGAIFYTIQLYADFSGCIDITIGMGEIFGITLPENFRRPFFSRTTSEFWRRWHITLGTWFKDYVFYPLSLTKFVKKLGKQVKARFGKHMGQVLPTSIALFAVWFCNGLWHGTGWNYIFFGIYYFVLIFLGNLLEPVVEKTAVRCKINRESIGYRIFQTVKMLIVIVIGELFFRAKGLAIGFSMLYSIFTDFSLEAFQDGSVWKLGLHQKDLIVIAGSLLILLIVGLLQERGMRIRQKVAACPMVLRWAIYYALILSIVILGAYGDGYVPAPMLYADF